VKEKIDGRNVMLVCGGENPHMLPCCSANYLGTVDVRMVSDTMLAYDIQKCRDYTEYVTIIHRVGQSYSKRSDLRFSLMRLLHRINESKVFINPEDPTYRQDAEMENLVTLLSYSSYSDMDFEANAKAGDIASLYYVGDISPVIFQTMSVAYEGAELPEDGGIRTFFITQDVAACLDRERISGRCDGQFSCTIEGERHICMMIPDLYGCYKVVAFEASSFSYAASSQGALIRAMFPALIYIYSRVARAYHNGTIGDIHIPISRPMAWNPNVLMMRDRTFDAFPYMVMTRRLIGVYYTLMMHCRTLGVEKSGINDSGLTILMKAAADYPLSDLPDFEFIPLAQRYPVVM
jgi:hypothetical protein